MKKVLISENIEKTKSEIFDLNQKAKQLTLLIEIYNNIEQLPGLTSVYRAEEFLKNPKEYFENRVRELIESEFSNKITFNLEAACVLLNISYSELFDKLRIVRPDKINVSIYTIEEVEGHLIVSLSKDKSVQIYEKNKVYISDKDEIQEYEYLSGICDALNEYIERYNLSYDYITNVAGWLKFKTITTTNGINGNGIRIFRLTPDIDQIRTHLKKFTKKQQP